VVVLPSAATSTGASGSRLGTGRGLGGGLGGGGLGGGGIPAGAFLRGGG
jgi:hypothetical protein